MTTIHVILYIFPNLNQVKLKYNGRLCAAFLLYNLSTYNHMNTYGLYKVRLVKMLAKFCLNIDKQLKNFKFGYMNICEHGQSSFLYSRNYSILFIFFIKNLI